LVIIRAWKCVKEVIAIKKINAIKNFQQMLLQYYSVSQKKTSPTFLAVTLESIVGFS